MIYKGNEIAITTSVDRKTMNSKVIYVPFHTKIDYKSSKANVPFPDPVSKNLRFVSSNPGFPLYGISISDTFIQCLDSKGRNYPLPRPPMYLFLNNVKDKNAYKGSGISLGSFIESSSDGLTPYERNIGACRLKLCPFESTTNILDFCLMEDFTNMRLLIATLEDDNSFDYPAWSEKDLDNEPTTLTIFGNFVIKSLDCWNMPMDIVTGTTRGDGYKFFS